MSVTYHIRIKKDYAASLIEDLQKMDAIELVKESEEDAIPAWHIEEVNRRIKKYKDRPDLLIDEDPVFNMLNAE